MSDKKRYHIHVCLVRNENSHLEDAIAYALSADYFLTWDLLPTHKSFVEYSRQQIDQCDYMLYILGENYGALSPSGVSYLHLNYIYAATTRIPMVALISSQASKNDTSRQRWDLFNLVNKEQGNRTVVYYTVEEGIKDAMRLFDELKTGSSRLGWVRGRHAVSEISKPNHPLKNTATTEESALTVTLAEKPQPSTTTNTAHIGVILPPIKVPVDVLQQKVLVNYSAHAYEGGNLRDIMAAHTFTWGEIIGLLQALPQPFTNDMMLRQLNDSLKESALIEASKVSAKVHAVSRCQLSAVDYQWLKNQLIERQWLVSAKEEKSLRELWRINVTP